MDLWSVLLALTAVLAAAGAAIIDLKQALAEMGLSKYHDKLASEEIHDASSVSLITEADLKELGIPLGPRRKLLAWGAKLRDEREEGEEEEGLLADEVGSALADGIHRFLTEEDTLQRIAEMMMAQQQQVAHRRTNTDSTDSSSDPGAVTSLWVKNELGAVAFGPEADARLRRGAAAKRLAASGGITLAGDDAECDQDAAGTLRFQGGAFSACNGASWVPFADEAAVAVDAKVEALRTEHHASLPGRVVQSWSKEQDSGGFCATGDSAENIKGAIGDGGDLDIVATGGNTLHVWINGGVIDNHGGRHGGRNNRFGQAGVRIVQGSVITDYIGGGFPPNIGEYQIGTAMATHEISGTGPQDVKIKALVRTNGVVNQDGGTQTAPNQICWRIDPNGVDYGIMHYLAFEQQQLLPPKGQCAGGDAVEYVDEGGTRYKAHVFRSTGALVCNGEVRAVDILLVGGGGGGGGFHGGGGGGGGVVDARDVVLQEEGAGPIARHAVVVGVGGIGGGTTSSADDAATNGGDTTFVGLTAVGGGHGGHFNSGHGADGGSGGGAAAYSPSLKGASTQGEPELSDQAASAGDEYAATSHGEAGGQTTYDACSSYAASGGGGAGAAAGDASGCGATAGGQGLQVSWVTPQALGQEADDPSLAYFWAGGGGGGNHRIALGDAGGGGNGGGGGGGATNGAGQGDAGTKGFTGKGKGAEAGVTSKGGAGGTNTGGGGGGTGTNASGGAGGSGIAVVRYPVTRETTE